MSTQTEPTELDTIFIDLFKEIAPGQMFYPTRTSESKELEKAKQNTKHFFTAFLAKENIDFNTAKTIRRKIAEL